MGTRTRLCLAPDLLRLTAMSHHSSCWRNASPRYFTQIRWRSTLRPKPALQRWKGAGQFLPPPGHLGWRPPRMVSLENLIPPPPLSSSPKPTPHGPPWISVSSQTCQHRGTCPCGQSKVEAEVTPTRSLPLFPTTLPDTPQWSPSPA